MADIEEFGPRLDRMLKKLVERRKRSKLVRAYATSECVIPKAVVDAKMTKAYSALMSMSTAPWATLPVDSKLDRLEVGGINTGLDKSTNDRLWAEAWQANAMDAMSKMADHGALTDGRIFASCWPDDRDGVEVVFDGADQMVVEYQEGRHQPRHRVAALRHWEDEDDRQHVTLYTPTALYKFSQAREQTAGDGRVRANDTWWEAREEPDEAWPLVNPFGVVPVIEIATNRQIGPGRWAYARGEYEHCLGVLDRINLLTFLGLVVALWMGFPLRYLIGDKIIRDDDGQPVPPFDSKPDSIAQLENPKAEIGQLEAADRSNLSVYAELQQFMYLTKTPAHYAPSETGFSNISADMIRALEGGMHAQVDGTHKPQLGEGYEELLRTVGLMLPSPIAVPWTAEVFWRDKQSRSLAERADAASKLKDVLPPEFIAEAYLDLSQEQLGRVRGALAGSALDRLMTDALAGGNGNGAVVRPQG